MDFDHFLSEELSLMDLEDESVTSNHKIIDENIPSLRIESQMNVGSSGHKNQTMQDGSLVCFQYFFLIFTDY